MSPQLGPSLSALAFSILCVAAPAWGSNHIVLPKDVTVVAPDGSIPADVAAFSGRWEGEWQSGVPHVLIIRKITADSKGKYKVDAVYAWGDSHGGGLRKNFRECDGTISGGQLEVLIPPRATATYKLVDGGAAIEGQWQASRTATFSGKFTKVSQ